MVNTSVPFILSFALGVALAWAILTFTNISTPWDILIGIALVIVMPITIQILADKTIRND